MKNYELKCEHCGQPFKSSRTDTKYCCNSCRVMASRQRNKGAESDQTTVLLKYSSSEYKKLSKSAKSAGISVSDMVKYRGLTTLEDIEGKNKEIEALKKETVRLKAHLSVYTKKPSSGIFLPVDEFQKEFISDNLNELDLLGEEENATFEEQLIYLGINCSSLVCK